MKCVQLIKGLTSGNFDLQLQQLYGTNEDVLTKQRIRYIDAIKKFIELYPESEEISIFSAPGRTEICGNHTDHQQGMVLAAAVNLDAIAVVSFNEDNVIRLNSVGYEPELIEINDLNINPDEKGTTRALLRGILAKFNEFDVKVRGFNVFVTSDVLSGSGLSSSAVFEVLIGNIIDKHYNDGKLGAIEIAKIGQFAENNYFGKGSGLMDQMVSSVGGFVHIDFKDTVNPIIQKHTCDFDAAGLKLIITDTKGSHADLTDEYVSIPIEMKSVASYFGKKVLREVDENEFYSSLPALRKSCSDRAILRATHFFGDNNRVSDEVKALDENDFDKFLMLVRESGKSSSQLLQNLYTTRDPANQAIPFALMLSERILKDKGAYRVHGGGFAGTIQAFVPSDLVDIYTKEMQKIFGDDSCYILDIRTVGGCQVI